MGPGWNLFHPPIKRKPKKVREVEEDVLDAFRLATEGPTPEAVREIKRAAATALSVARTEQDADLEDMAQRIIALRKLELDVESYVARVGEIIRAEEDDDMEALELMMRLA